MTTQPTGDLTPRWYSSGVLLPTGEVVAFSGADRDEVAGPGVEYPGQAGRAVRPETQTWQPIATGDQPTDLPQHARCSCPTAEVLVGGHARSRRST